ncbi:MAG: hypothetical protein WBC55_03345 [Dehalococcoidia bacterium]
MGRKKVVTRLAMRSPNTIFKTTKEIYQREGLAPLLKRAFAFAAGHLVQYRRFYLFEFPTKNIKHLTESDFMPKIDDFTLKIVSIKQEADALEAEGLEFRSYVSNADDRLDKGAIAFCIFVGQELANISWIAMTLEAQRSLREAPCKVHFSRNEAYRGGIWTNPKFRRMGFSLYSLWKKLEFLQERGIPTSRAIIAKGNVTPQLGHTKFAPIRYGEGRYLRILWWKSWKEKQLPPQEVVQ